MQELLVAIKSLLSTFSLDRSIDVNTFKLTLPYITSDTTTMAAKIILVTGANTGIGYETVKCFVESPNRYHVYLGSRSVQKGKDAIEKLRAEIPSASNTVELLQIDVTSDESIQKAYDVVEKGSGHVDVLINNAGMLLQPSNSGRLDSLGAGFDPDFLAGKMSLRESFNNSYDVNVSSANVVAWTFIPLLLKSAEPRLIFVAGLSQMTQAAESYFPTPPLPAGWPKKLDYDPIGYRCSKTALSMLMLDWNHKLKADGVKVFSVSPDFCATNLMGEEIMAAMGAVHPREGGERLIVVAEGKRDADAGKIIDKEGLLPW